MDKVEIYFHNLDKETQKELLKLYKVKNPKDMNWDAFPIHIIEAPVEDEEEEEDEDEEEFEEFCRKCGKCITKIEFENYGDMCESCWEERNK